MDLQVPAELGKPWRHRQHCIDRLAGAEVLHVVEAHAAEALRVQALELRFGRIGSEERDAAIVPRPRGDQIGGGRVVETVGRRLHDDAALDAEMRVQREERLLRRIAGRRVSALGYEGKARLRPEDMEVRIGGARRQLEPRLSRLRLE